MKKRIGCFCVSFLIMFLNGLCMANESMVAHSEESSAYVIISTEPQEYTEIQRQKRTGFMKKMLSGLHEESWAAYAFWAAEAVEPGIPLHEYLEQLEKENIYYQGEPVLQDDILILHFLSDLWLEIKGDPIQEADLCIRYQDAQLSLPINIAWQEMIDLAMSGVPLGGKAPAREMVFSPDDMLRLYKEKCQEPMTDLESTHPSSFFVHLFRSMLISGYTFEGMRPEYLSWIEENPFPQMAISHDEEWTSFEWFESPFFASTRLDVSYKWDEEGHLIFVNFRFFTPIDSELFQLPARTNGNHQFHFPSIYVDLSRTQLNNYVGTMAHMN